MDHYTAKYRQLVERTIADKRDLLKELDAGFDQLRADLCCNDGIISRFYPKQRSGDSKVGEREHDYAQKSAIDFVVKKALHPNSFRKSHPDLFGYYRNLSHFLKRQRDKVAVAIEVEYQKELVRLEENYKKIVEQLESEGLLAEDPDLAESAKLPAVPNPSASPSVSGLVLMNAGALDLVPTQVAPPAVALSGHTERYLVDFCQRNGVTTRQLHALIELKNEYETDFPTFERFLGYGCDLDDLRVLYSTRELVVGATDPVMENRKIGAEEKRARKGATLESIHAFRQKFMPGEADPDALAASINEAHTRVKGDFVNISLAVAVETAEKLGPAGNLHLETVLSVLDGTIMDDPYYRMVFQPGADPSDPRDPDS